MKPNTSRSKKEVAEIVGMLIFDFTVIGFLSASVASFLWAGSIHGHQPNGQSFAPNAGLDYSGWISWFVIGLVFNAWSLAKWRRSPETDTRSLIRLVNPFGLGIWIGILNWFFIIGIAKAL